MSFNGSGTFNRVHNWIDDAANSIKIRADRMDAEFDGVATGLSTCITKDGQTTVAANLPMAGFRHTGVGSASARDHYGVVGQTQDGAYLHATSGGSTGAYTLTLAPAIAAYAAGQMFTFKANHASTSAATLNVNGVGAKAIQQNGAALSYGEIQTNDVVVVVYDDTQFQVVSVTKGTGWRLIQSQTISSGVATVDFTVGIDSAYDLFKFVLTDIHLDASAKRLWLRTDSNGGASFDNGASDYEYTNGNLDSGASGWTSGNASSGTTEIATSLADIDNVSTSVVSGICYLPSPAAGGVKFLWGDIVYVQATSSNAVRSFFTGRRKSTAAINAVQWGSSASNYDGGTIALYGLRK